MNCSQLTTEGKPCRKPAMRGSDRCSVHLGMGGRKTALSPELADQLVVMLRSGNYIAIACQAVGISRRTFSNWLTRGRTGDPEFASFLERVEKAQAEGEVVNVARIATAAAENWQAAAWMLERSHPERWGKVSTRFRMPEEEPAPHAPEVESPFAEVVELAARRRRGE